MARRQSITIPRIRDKDGEIFETNLREYHFRNSRHERGEKISNEVDMIYGETNNGITVIWVFEQEFFAKRAIRNEFISECADTW